MLARRTGSGSADGSGTRPSMPTTMSGEVPQVTMGSSVLASIVNSRSKAAPSSLTNVRQAATADSHWVPCGACGRPRR